MPTTNSRTEPFIGYRVALTREADASSLLRLGPSHLAVRALMAGQRSVTLPVRDVAAVYNAAESISRARGEPFLLQFTPVRVTCGRALPFESVALRDCFLSGRVSLRDLPSEAAARPTDA